MSGPKISKSGPVVVNLKSGGSLDLWYNREIRSWVLQLKDVAGNQTGPGVDGEAAYHHHREDAVEEMLALYEEDKKATEAAQAARNSMTDAQKLEVLKQALTDLKEAAEYRLRKGPDSGDQSTVRIATDALARIAR